MQSIATVIGGGGIKHWQHLKSKCLILPGRVIAISDDFLFFKWPNPQKSPEVMHSAIKCVKSHAFRFPLKKSMLGVVFQNEAVVLNILLFHL